MTLQGEIQNIDIREQAKAADKRDNIVTVEVDGKPTKCKLVDASKYYAEHQDKEGKMIKVAPVEMRESRVGDVLSPKQDAASRLVLKEAGYPILTNPGGEDPYAFYNDGESPEQAMKRFEETYVKASEITGNLEDQGWIKKNPFNVIQVEENIAIRPSWDPNGFMATPAGGYLAEGGYTIVPSSVIGSDNTGENPNYKLIDEQ